jgi:hypothetical protein
MSKIDLTTGYKVIHAGDDWNGQPFLLVADEAIVLAGSLENGMVVDPDFGTLMQGPISLSESPEKISFCGGYWRINPAVLSCVGSSAAMPVPWLIPDEPELLKARKDIKDIVGGL